MTINIKPVFEIFGKEISIYGIFCILGVALAAFAMIFLYKKRISKMYDLVYCSVFAGISGFIFAKLFFIVIHIQTIIEYKLGILAVLQGGFVFYGGLIGGFIGILIYCRMFKMDLAPFLDLFSVALPLGHAIGRFGCLTAGCCYGMEYNGPFSITYGYSVSDTPVGVPLLPIQLIEALCLLLLFCVLLFIYEKTKAKNRTVCCVYIISYAVIRFILEYFRGDVERGNVGIFSTSQFIGIILIVITLAGIIIQKTGVFKKKNKA